MKFADFMAEQQIAERVERVERRGEADGNGDASVRESVSGMPPRIAEFEMLVHAMEGERVVFRTPVEPPWWSRELLETLGAVIVIDPSAPPIKFGGHS